MGFYQKQILPQLINLAMRNHRIEPYRRRVVDLAEGVVLEIGAGSGMNLPLYTGRVGEVFALEPVPKLVAMAREKPHRVPVAFLEASAEAIPLGAASIDTVVTTWTLCSIPDISAALAEMRRVLKPSGKLLFVEHGLAPEENVRKWQRRLNPAWKRLAGGCNLDRPMDSLIQQSGFRLRHIESAYMPGPKPMTFMYEGVASPF